MPSAGLEDRSSAHVSAVKTSNQPLAIRMPAHTAGKEAASTIFVRVSNSNVPRYREARNRAMFSLQVVQRPN